MNPTVTLPDPPPPPAAPGERSQAGAVSVRIAGGLGNQMFQYAAARALSLRHRAPLELDLSFYDASRHRAYQLDAFALGPLTVVQLPPRGPFPRLRAVWHRAIRRWKGKLRPLYREPDHGPDPVFDQLVPPVHLIGHFQSARYFDDQQETIRSELRPPPPQDPLSREMAGRMGARSVALHVRRGDYVSIPKNAALFASLGPDYYDRALRSLPGPLEVFVFSDDILWARAHLPRVHPLVFVEDGTPRSGLADLWLMTRARHHVIANSSLSWWGAWLAAVGEGQRIAPARWYVDPQREGRYLVPEGWRRL